MKNAIDAKTLERSALAAHALFSQRHSSRLDGLVDRHFVVEHLVPTLYHRLQAHLPLAPADLAELWAEHLGLSEGLLARWKPRLEPLFAELLALLAAQLQSHPQTPRLLHRALDKAS